MTCSWAPKRHLWAVMSSSHDPEALTIGGDRCIDCASSVLLKRSVFKNLSHEHTVVTWTSCPLAAATLRHNSPN